jgi:NAD(P)-dependent dehydrogenase (short-subunit alcohol dehydrogenase family)
MEQSRSGPMAGRTVLVTGGSGGIGRATALGLAAMGAHLAITGRDRGRTEDAAREIRAAGGQVDVFVADLFCQAQVRRLAGEVLQRLSRIDALVNNAGGYWNTRHVTADGLERTFALSTSVTANALHPGVVRTAFGAEDPSGVQRLFTPFMRPIMKAPAQGAATSIYLSSAPDLEQVTGRYFVRSKPRRSSKRSNDQAAAARLWQVSADLAGLAPAGIATSARPAERPT